MANEERPKFTFTHYENSDFLYNANNNLISRKDQLTYNGVDIYQICIYPHPKTKQYSVRRFIITANNEISAVKMYRLTEEQVKKLKAKLQQNQVKCFSCYDFDGISEPDIRDILLAQSQLLDRSQNYTGNKMFSNF